MIEQTFDNMSCVGYRGKLAERALARTMRAEGTTMPDIAAALGVSRSSVSLWTRDVEVAMGPRRRPVRRGPNSLQRRKADEIEAMAQAGAVRIGCLTDREYLVAGVALYAGEGSKRDGDLVFTNSDPRLVGFFCDWMRAVFEIDESKFRVRLYLHQGLDLAAAVEHWVGVTGVPADRFYSPYRAAPDPGIRTAKHAYGCASVRYLSTRTHRAIMGLIAALLSSARDIPG
ncbi:MAG: hypothetical protein NVS3B21_00280 [Acidimicrobiales bacterium]